MKVGDYVRTKIGIFQIRSKPFKEGKEEYIGVNGRYTALHTYIIKKSSPNIIDLIEVGDYVNGMKVFEVMKNPEIDDIKEHLIVFVNEIKNELYTIYGNEIKSIVTREQFEQLEYKL